MTPDTVAIDRGGTSLRLFAARAGKIMACWEGPTRSLSSLKKWLEDFWAARGWPRVARLIVGSKGVWTPSERRRWARRWAGLARRVTVLSDAELGHHAILGNQEGIFLIAGTGSLALARDRRGRWTRAGGLGPRRGDEGSGWWMGKEYLKRTGHPVPAAPSPHTLRRVAARAERIVRGTSPLEKTLQREAAGHLVALVHSLKRQHPVPVVLAGSLFKARGFRHRVEKELKDCGGFHCVRAAENPARAAARRPDQFPARSSGAWPRRGAKK